MMALRSRLFPAGAAAGDNPNRGIRLARVSAFADLDAIGPQDIWNGVAVRAVHGEQITLGVVELEPNSVVPEHRHENEQLGMVLSGSLTFRVGDESRQLRSGGTWCVPANAPHEVTAGPEGAVVLDVFAPTRDDWAAFEPQAPRAPRWP
jgi:quercetin dioxygenase-like cupin family protein